MVKEHFGWLVIVSALGLFTLVTDVVAGDVSAGSVSAERLPIRQSTPGGLDDDNMQLLAAEAELLQRLSELNKQAPEVQQAAATPAIKSSQSSSAVEVVASKDGCTQELDGLKIRNQQLEASLRATQARVTKLIVELRQAHNQLLVAETEVERLSDVIHIRNKQRKLPEVDKVANTASERTSAPVLEESDTDMLIATVSVSKANLRTGPGLNNSPIMSVSRGTRLAIERRLGGWYRVLAPNGTRAWVSGSVIEFGKSGYASPTRTVRVKAIEENDAETEALELIRKRLSK